LVGALVRDATGAPLGTIEATIVERGSTVGLLFDYRGKPVGLRSPSPLLSSITATRTVTLDVAQAAEVLAALAPYQKRVGEPPGPQVRTSVSCDGIEVDAAGGARQCIKPGSGKSTWFKDCPTCPEMVVVPAGRFTMGSPASEPARLEREDQVQVAIVKPFAVGRFAVTRGEFTSFIGDTGHKTDGGCYTWSGRERKLQSDRSWRSAGFAQDERHPVVCVNLDDAKAYAAWLSAKTGKTYRLLSESEREYVTRAGTTTPFWWGSSITPSQANYNGSAEPYEGGGSKGEYRQRTVPVDSFEANPWGLYNVHGNVWEWTDDCWNDNNAGNPGNGSARTSSGCSFRGMRGGSWHNSPRSLRAANRSVNHPVDRDSFLGFRLARTLP
jgi:formylglycine-generating enzyme required for sulfatase activity